MTYIFLLISTYRYWIIFPLMIVEGPIITIIAAFLASLGSFNVFIIYILALSGNVIADIGYYCVGKFGGKRFLVKYGKYIGVNLNKIELIENHYNKHLIKTIIVAKVTEVLIVPTLISAGIANTDFKKFLIVSFLSEIFKVLIIVLIGYYFGKFYLIIDSYYKDFVIVMFIIFVVIIAFLIHKRIKK